MRLITSIHALKWVALFSCVFISCLKPPQGHPFAINDDMNELKWAEKFKAVQNGDEVLLPVSNVINGSFPRDKVLGYYKQIKPGDILHLDCFSGTQPHGTSLTLPAHYSFDIPVRLINEEYGKLKGYEKDFLLTYLATNIKAKFNKVPSELALVRLWNYIMSNIWMVKDAKANSVAKVRVNYDRLKTALLDHDPTFKDQLGQLKGASEVIVLPRTSAPLLSGYFEGSLADSRNTPAFYDPEPSDRTFSFVQFSVVADAAYYKRNLSTAELASWSVYDWVNSGIAMYDKENKQKELKYIVFKKYAGRYEIRDGTSDHPNVYYNTGSFRLRSRKPKVIYKKDLADIFPSATQRLIFK